MAGSWTHLSGTGPWLMTSPAATGGPRAASGSSSLDRTRSDIGGPVAGAVTAVGAAQVLRGSARAQEASAAMPPPLDHNG
jgi:hypothetical protein